MKDKISIIDKTKRCNSPTDAIEHAKRMRKKYDKTFIVGFKKFLTVKIRVSLFLFIVSSLFF